MNNIVKFEFEGHEVRRIDGRDELIAKDVCEVLGLGNVTNALRGLDDDEITNCKVVDSAGREQEMKGLTLPGVYRLTCRSRKPVARRFSRWVFHEVLPSIYETGGYVEPGREAEFLRVLQEQGRLILELTHEIKCLREWKESREQEHPYGLVGRRDAKALRGMFVAIRDMRIRIGDKRAQLVVYRAVDDEIRRLVGYPNEKGASWANATQEQGRRAFSAAAKMAEALRRDLDKVNTKRADDPRQPGLFPKN